MFVCSSTTYTCQDLGGGLVRAGAGVRAHGGVGGGAGHGAAPRHPVADRGRQHPRPRHRQHRRHLHPQPDRGGPAPRIPRHQGLHRRQARDGGRE